MYSFRIIPVIDILNFKTVHAIKGERTKYKPLKSKFIKSTNPLDIINILKKNFSFSEFYIADLDAIIKNRPNFEILSKILEISETKIILDPGITTKDDILTYSRFKLHKLILGLETINGYNVIKEGLKILEPDKLIVSIDMFKGEVISNVEELKDQNPLDIINKLEKYGIKEIILLDLFRVGQKIGGTPPLYIEIRERFKGDILVGGGIKSIKDLMKYNKNKFSGVLIATALYDGTIKAEEVKNFK